MLVFINLCAFVSNLSGFDEFRHSLLARLFNSQVNVRNGLKFGFSVGDNCEIQGTFKNWGLQYAPKSQFLC